MLAVCDVAIQLGLSSMRPCESPERKRHACTIPHTFSRWRKKPPGKTSFARRAAPGSSSPARTDPPFGGTSKRIYGFSPRRPYRFKIVARSPIHWTNRQGARAETRASARGPESRRDARERRTGSFVPENKHFVPARSGITAKSNDEPESCVYLARTLR